MPLRSGNCDNPFASPPFMVEQIVPDPIQHVNRQYTEGHSVVVYPDREKLRPTSGLCWGTMAQGMQKRW